MVIKCSLENMLRGVSGEFFGIFVFFDLLNLNRCFYGYWFFSLWNSFVRLSFFIKLFFG